MNLYLIYQDQNRGYDTYDCAVVAAKNENDARNTHPRNYPNNNDWCLPEYVEVTLIGKAHRETKPGIICASFNAG